MVSTVLSMYSPILASLNYPDSLPVIISALLLGDKEEKGGSGEKEYECLIYSFNSLSRFIERVDVDSWSLKADRIALFEVQEWVFDFFFKPQNWGEIKLDKLKSRGEVLGKKVSLENLLNLITRIKSLLVIDPQHFWIVPSIKGYAKRKKVEEVASLEVKRVSSASPEIREEGLYYIDPGDFYTLGRKWRVTVERETLVINPVEKAVVGRVIPLSLGSVKHVSTRKNMSLLSGSFEGVSRHRNSLPIPVPMDSVDALRLFPVTENSIKLLWMLEAEDWEGAQLFLELGDIIREGDIAGLKRLGDRVFGGVWLLSKTEMEKRLIANWVRLSYNILQTFEDDSRESKRMYWSYARELAVSLLHNLLLIRRVKGIVREKLSNEELAEKIMEKKGWKNWEWKEDGKNVLEALKAVKKAISSLAFLLPRPKRGEPTNPTDRIVEAAGILGW